MQDNCCRSASASSATRSSNSAAAAAAAAIAASPASDRDDSAVEEPRSAEIREARSYSIGRSKSMVNATDIV